MRFTSSYVGSFPVFLEVGFYRVANFSLQRLISLGKALSIERQRKIEISIMHHAQRSHTESEFKPSDLCL